MRIEGCHKAADLRVVQFCVANKFDSAALCDIGDSTVEEGGVDAKNGGRAWTIAGNADSGFEPRRKQR